jgi:hypothetical protein
MTLTLLLLACATSGQSTPSQTSTTEPDPIRSQPFHQDADCMKMCLRNNMARAVAAEVIEADCRKSCDTTKTPMKPLEHTL